ncbi:hypothetical protein ACFVGM_09070 [Kitasatospora purpeofusca]|uniref:hypothetical protein n=1 Tax=Kitasatospora purpeofusca TaxID=67352 RepID=UPI0036ABA3AC
MHPTVPQAEPATDRHLQAVIYDSPDTHHELVRQLLDLADEIEQNPGLGSQWHANMRLAARIRDIAAPDLPHTQPSVRDAHLAALNASRPPKAARDHSRRAA